MSAAPRPTPQITPATVAAMKQPPTPLKPQPAPPTNRERATHVWLTEVIAGYKADKARAQTKANKAKSEDQRDRFKQESAQVEFFDELLKFAEAGWVARQPKAPVNQPTQQGR